MMLSFNKNSVKKLPVFNIKKNVFIVSRLNKNKIKY